MEYSTKAPFHQIFGAACAILSVVLNSDLPTCQIENVDVRLIMLLSRGLKAGLYVGGRNSKIKIGECERYRRILTYLPLVWVRAREGFWIRNPSPN